MSSSRLGHFLGGRCDIHAATLAELESDTSCAHLCQDICSIDIGASDNQSQGEVPNEHGNDDSVLLEHLRATSPANLAAWNDKPQSKKATLQPVIAHHIVMIHEIHEKIAFVDEAQLIQMQLHVSAIALSHMMTTLGPRKTSIFQCSGFGEDLFSNVVP